MNARLQMLCFTLLLLFSATQVFSTDLKALEQNLSDSLISTKITARFAENKLLNPLKIHVSTELGVVTLSGHVDSKAAYIQALRIAKDVSGVKDIDSEDLIIKKVNTALADALITAKIETSILKAKVFDDESIPLVGINASTNNGTVTLDGFLDSETAISAVIKRASAVRGVKKIISHLEVKKATA